MASPLASRMIWPFTAGLTSGSTKTVNGHAYVVTEGQVFDALAADVSGLVSAGAVLVAQSGAVPLSLQGLPASGGALPSGYTMMPAPTGGPTSPQTDPNRPGLGTVNPGALYLDAFLQRLIVWSGNDWRDVWTGQAV